MNQHRPEVDAQREADQARFQAQQDRQRDEDAAKVANENALITIRATLREHGDHDSVEHAEAMRGIQAARTTPGFTRPHIAALRERTVGEIRQSDDQDKTQTQDPDAQRRRRSRGR
ncbi:hypothetical protein [Micromonospora sp. SH-82]|uniref:hypothetical protein n=1 Tax=Micromonospora sp. SH-82 TaxID=3132938 RepID=UPI003EB9E3AF